MAGVVYMDTETYSETPITDGTYKYAANAEIMLFMWAVDDGDVQVWDCTEDHTMPKDLFDILKYGDQTLVWQNSMFDRAVLKYARGIELPPERMHDTMVIALQHSLPGGLEKLCDIFKIGSDDAKHKAGKKLIQLFCKPRPKNQKLRRATKDTHPEEWEAFKDYGISDITSMRAVYKKLPKWNHNLEFERKLWCLDQKINDRGFMVDIGLVDAAMHAIDEEKKVLATKAHDKSKGYMQRATQRDRFLRYILKEYDVELPDLTKSTLERRVNDTELPQNVRDLIAIRLDASTTSTSKYLKLKNGVLSDDRLRGTLQFCGAPRTGRWAGRTFQPQNLPRPSHSQAEIEEGIKAVKLGCLDLVADDVMKMTSSMLRSSIVASPEKKLVVSDLSNIEGRVAAWLAGETWKVEAFRDFDEGRGHDLYKLAYARSFDVSPDSVDKEQRQLGKVQELALGYGGGVGAFVTMATTYGMDLEEVAAKAAHSIPDAVMAQAVSWWDRSSVHYGLSQKVFTVCDALKRLWRGAQPNIAKYWFELEEGVKKAIDNPNNTISSGYLKIAVKGKWLRIQLPSERTLCYPFPKVDQDDGRIKYMGMCPYSRKWKELSTYGGKLFENVCQAVARDVMAVGMIESENRGFNILLTVHDELITETENTNATSENVLSHILATPPAWAPGIPLAAGGFEGYRYRKD